ncbi:DEAD/DEAH box helicase family protein [Ferroplasma acidiphilum]|uniref:DEAD/DEAH box helicase family protein n=1 Tax=Ferroplasma acidiphilum TaxID=74969 RepID=UPI0023F28A51|nr:DEAD/DEAH box helicase family protein [Ferroplasma acidiphilum]
MLEKGLYEKLINFCLRNELNNNTEIESLEKALVNDQLSRILAAYVGERTKHRLDIMEDKRLPVSDRLDFVNNLLDKINSDGRESTSKEKIHINNPLDKISSKTEQNCDNIESPPKILLSAYPKNNENKKIDLTIRPDTSVAYSSLFTGSSNEPQFYYELQKEIQTSDQVDMLVSFIKWTGLRLIIKKLKEFTDNGGRLRVITTTYMGVTDIKAIEELAKLTNTEIKISYDTKNTRMHAKTYIFLRNTGYSTAYVGSSNLSGAAISSGLEWNLKITKIDMQDVFDKIDATFDSYWSSEAFESFSPDQLARLNKALKNESSINNSGNEYSFDFHPYPYQSKILEELRADRQLRGNYHNLVVSATGTGKTIISAFDYKQFVREHPDSSNRLLFIAHREEILKQSIACFRNVLKDPEFGNLYVGNYKPLSDEHLFMSIQTFESIRPDLQLDKHYYDFIIIDEFHHAAAKSYANLLNHFNPEIMLGLTATPERMDGRDILKYFNNHITSEIRLPEAIDQHLLCPFQYFGITDSVDLENIAWKKGSYDVSELENLYVKNSGARERAKLIIDAVRKYSTDINSMKALGFCVTKAHAKFMAHYFQESGIQSIALTSDSTHQERNDARIKLVFGQLPTAKAVSLQPGCHNGQKNHPLQ